MGGGAYTTPNLAPRQSAHLRVRPGRVDEGVLRDAQPPWCSKRAAVVRSSTPRRKEDRTRVSQPYSTPRSDQWNGHKLPSALITELPSCPAR